ncbi:hypothetical protein K440DRAFT_621127 [Wilcoxina mikolae CBS 423.85]|nr:hypothetical protein K440DRAFT_621127 [Wilcoxina mikolae CBS 423.85]
MQPLIFQAEVTGAIYSEPSNEYDLLAQGYHHRHRRGDRDRDRVRDRDRDRDRDRYQRYLQDMFQRGSGRIEQRYGRDNGQLQPYAGGAELDRLRRDNENLRMQLNGLQNKIDDYKRENYELKQNMGYAVIGGGGSDAYAYGRGGLGRLY